MSKWDYIEVMREMFSDEDLMEMFVYWLDISEVERCIEDFLSDRDLEIRNGYIKEK